MSQKIKQDSKDTRLKFDRTWERFVEEKLGLKELIADPDGSFKGCVLPKIQTNMIWYTSWFLLVPSWYAYQRNYIDLCLVPFIVFWTSILYWCEADYSYRRYLDIFFVVGGEIYQVIRARNAENRIGYYLLNSLSMICFSISVYFKGKSSWLSAFFHMLLHIIGDIAYLVLCSGFVPPPI